MPEETSASSGCFDTIAYTYENEWQDQLTAVNGVPLNYDANGNLTSYGDTAYSWSHGKWLNTVTVGDNTYLYKYDSNGIRASKRVNGITTNFDTLTKRKNSIVKLCCQSQVKGIQRAPSLFNEN